MREKFLIVYAESHFEQTDFELLNDFLDRGWTIKSFIPYYGKYWYSLLFVLHKDV